MVGERGGGRGMIFSPQDFILQFFELSLSGSDVDDQRILLFLQLWSFLPNHNAQQLGF